MRNGPSRPLVWTVPWPSTCAGASVPRGARARSRHAAAPCASCTAADASATTSARRCRRTRCARSPMFLGGALHDLVGRQVFLVRRDRPHVAERIDDGARAIAVELVLDGADELRAGGHGAL